MLQVILVPFPVGNANIYYATKLFIVIGQYITIEESREDFEGGLEERLTARKFPPQHKGDGFTPSQERPSQSPSDKNHHLPLHSCGRGVIDLLNSLPY